MARNGTAYRTLVPHDRPPDYVLLVTGQVMPHEVNPLPPERPGARGSAPGYLPRWRSGARQRRAKA